MTAPNERIEPSPIETYASTIRVELQALSAIVEAFEAMPVEAHRRTLRYLLDRYGERGGADVSYRPPVAARPSERPGP